MQYRCFDPRRKICPSANAGGTDVEMVQETDYPWNGKVTITVKPKAAKQFAVRLRVPNRATSKLYTTTPEVNGLVSLAVNGKTYHTSKVTRAAAPDQNRVEVNLKAGKNEVLIKIANGNNPHGAYVTILSEQELKAGK